MFDLSFTDCFDVDAKLTESDILTANNKGTTNKERGVQLLHETLVRRNEILCSVAGDFAPRRNIITKILASVNLG